MSRVKRGNVARKRRKKLLNRAKGFRGSLSKLIRPASQALLHAGNNAYRDRRLKKRSFRQLWILRINAFLEQNNMSYSVFMGKCKKKNIELNRKVLANLAVDKPEVLTEILNFINK